MNHFSSIRKLDQAILYSLELASSLSVLLLAFGLIASMANVLTKGSVLSDNLIMQRVWAWTQCIAIDASVAGTIIRTYQLFEKRSWATFTLYAVLSCLLLFTAALVSNIESVQQTLNITLDSAYTHVFISVEALIWVRSIVIVLLLVAHALRHVQTEKQQPEQQVLPEITPELLEKLRVLLATANVAEEQQQPSQIPETPAAPKEQEAGSNRRNIMQKLSQLLLSLDRLYFEGSEDEYEQARQRVEMQIQKVLPGFTVAYAAEIGTVSAVEGATYMEALLMCFRQYRSIPTRKG